MPSALVRAVRPGDNTAHTVWRAALRSVSTSRPGLELADLAAAAQAPSSTGRRIAVVSVRGGAGKSVVTALLASLYATRRADPVLAVDADRDGGSLPWLLALGGVPPLAALAPRILAGGGADPQVVADSLPRTRSGLWALGGGETGLVGDATRALSRLFPVVVVDCPTGLTTAAPVVSDAHTIVLVTPATPDGVRSTCQALDRAGSDGRVVVVLNDAHRGGRAALHRHAALRALERYAVPVAPMPYDRHVACAAPIEVGRIAERTLLATSRLAAQVLAVARARW